MLLSKISNCKVTEPKIENGLSRKIVHAALVFLKILIFSSFPGYKKYGKNKMRKQLSISKIRL